MKEDAAATAETAQPVTDGHETRRKEGDLEWRLSIVFVIPINTTALKKEEFSLSLNCLVWFEPRLFCVLFKQ